MQPWSGVCARHLPRVTAHSQQAHIFSLYRLPGPSHRASSWGDSLIFYQDSCLTVLSLGSSGRLVTLKRILPHVTRAAFLDHIHHLLVYFQLRAERPPRALSPMALPRRSLPSGPVLPSHVPCRVTRSSHHPGQAVCSVLGRPL